MATVKRFSVSITDDDTISTDNASTVYSVTGCKGASSSNTLPAGSWCTPAYQYADGECMPVGRTPDTFVAKVGAGNPTATATGLPAGYDGVTQKAGVPGTPRNTKVICTTTTTEAGSTAAGLIVEFTTTDEATPQNPAAQTSGTDNYTIVTFGNGYAENDTVEIDGFPGSVLTIAGLTE